ncbi:MAG TPA: peroxiredoxin [Candidatus Xenobia bacterium]|jgi:peroxiredoxin (alkyl hydroperoxide reductase subunit C)
MSTATLEQQNGHAVQEHPRLELNGQAPDFEANTTHGPVKLHDWQKDKWVILFSHPADFTPVCTTEFAEFARMYPEFEKRNVALLGNSIDSVYSHIAWVRDIEKKFNVKVAFPVIADLDQKVSRLYGMVHTPSAATATVRCVFFIDPKRVLRAMIYYPLNVGRNFDEILRVVEALQTADKHGVACPANWKPGEEVIVPAPLTQKGADDRAASKEFNVSDWYLSKKKV